MFNRIDAKMQAKASMRQASPSPILVTLVFLLLTTVLFRVLDFVLFDPWSIILADLREGYTLEESLYYLIQENSAGLAAFPAIQCIISVYQTVMSFGYCSYALRLARNEGPGYANLFDGFARFFRVLWMNILIGIFAGLWGLMAMIPAFVLIVAVAVAGASGASITGVTIIVGFTYLLMIVAVAVVLIITLLRYLLAPYFLLDDPTCTAREAIRRSKRAMRGWKMEAFTLGFSFLGWTILSAMTLGILDIWVLPYRQVTYANFYDCVTGGINPSGGSVGPDYSAPGNAPLPF